MELRQLRYFVRAVELGSMSRAALDLDLVQSAMSQQISRLEGELATRLLQRSSKGVVPTEAGLAFFREAQLTLRHAEHAVRAAQQSRLSGTASVGLASTTAGVLGVPLMRAMRERYPDVRLHLVESMSGHLTQMLNARQLDLAVLFDTGVARRWSVMPLLEEKLYLMRPRPTGPATTANAADMPDTISMAQLQGVPLILPTGAHGLRSTLDVAFDRARLKPNLVAEVDSLTMLMDAVCAGLGCTVQPWAALGRVQNAAQRLQWTEIADAQVRRSNALCSLSDDELSPAALATRVVLADCARALVTSGQWEGSRLIHHKL
ncbi:MAG: LysR family transcriptional regulator [Polaromonas sp.]|nr:LysR family transcriptional regulator [Polaromonas sp.]